MASDGRGGRDSHAPAVRAANSERRHVSHSCADNWPDSRRGPAAGSLAEGRLVDVGVNEARRSWARAEVDRALRGEGFRQTHLRQGSPVYEGEIASGRLPVPIALAVVDVFFTTAPSVRVTDRQMEARIEAHVDGAGEFCYIDRGRDESIFGKDGQHFLVDCRRRESQR